MATYLVRRIVSALLVLIGVTLLVFGALRLGSPCAGSDDMHLTDDDCAILRQVFRLDRPLYEQYAAFVWDALHGNFGRSIRSRALVFDELMLRLPATIELGGVAYLLAWCIALPAGVLAAVRRGRPIDLLCRLVSLIGISAPGFWLGALLILVFSVWLRWLPVSGRGDGLVGGLQALVLPSISLGLIYAGTLTRLVRAGLLEVLSADHVRVARAKGLPERQVVRRHALRNALIPLVTIAGLQLGSLLGGAVVIETVFSWPGIGRLVVAAISGRDYPVVQGVVTVLAAVLILANLAVDLLYTAIDPRIRLA